MLKEGATAPNGSGCSSNGSRICDTCRSAACVVYCRADSAYLCSGCDARIHAANWVASRHERVWVCDACERAPAVFLCRADAASLCSSCDADIHSANPLASRHHRVPLLPISGCTLINGKEGHGCEVEQEEEGGGDEAEAASWLLLNDLVRNDDANESNGFLLCGEVGSVDEYLELVDCNNSRGENDKFGTVRYGDDGDHEQQQDNYGCIPQKNCAVVDSVVPVQNQMQKQFQPGFECESLKAAFSYNGSVSISSMEVGIVPESTVSYVSISHSKPPNGMVDLFSEPPIQMQSYLTPVDREARVLRYREKKKRRKFEKKIRYASRKAYAETRPRIKGRFAKRTDVEAKVDQMLSSTLLTDAGYSIVPSF